MLTMLNHPGEPPLGYSHAVAAMNIGSLLFVSGQVGVGPDGTVPDSVAEQARIASDNLLALLEQAGMDKSNIAKFTIYLTDESHMGDFMAGAAHVLGSPPPAATLLVVKALAAPNLKVEIEAIAVG